MMQENKILLTADAHYNKNEKRRRQFEIFLEKAVKVGPYRYVFFGGDMISGLGGKGLSYPEAKKNIQDFFQTLNKYFLPKAYKNKQYFIAGNHELGYRFPWSPDKQGRLSEEALEIFEKEFNKLFFTLDNGQYKFLIVSSDLELISEKNKKIPESILKKKQEQKEFYRDILNETRTKNAEKIILMLHDPDALNPMFKFLEQHLDKIEKTFAGHHHTVWQRKLLEYSYRLADNINFKDSRLIKKVAPNYWQKTLGDRQNYNIWRKCKLITIPAPGGVLGAGGGFLVAYLTERGIKIQRMIPRKS